MLAAAMPAAGYAEATLKAARGGCDRGDFGKNIFHGHNSKIDFLHNAHINPSNKTKLTI
ncbi:hypothetical protein [uncultured Nostoc sp.]|uniref:hypothetical protein n=1 Tax=uncultured Nostoc sp. TaxID=340711 RepID=UPI0035C9D923